MNSDEQLAAFDKYSKQATYALRALLCRHQSRIIVRARERMETLGLREYGDKSWGLSLEGLKQETLDELADGVVYQSMYLNKQRENK